MPVFCSNGQSWNRKDIQEILMSFCMDLLTCLYVKILVIYKWPCKLWSVGFSCWIELVYSQLRIVFKRSCRQLLLTTCTESVTLSVPLDSGFRIRYLLQCTVLILPNVFSLCLFLCKVGYCTCLLTPLFIYWYRFVIYKIVIREMSDLAENKRSEMLGIVSR